MFFAPFKSHEFAEVHHKPVEKVIWTSDTRVKIFFDLQGFLHIGYVCYLPPEYDTEHTVSH